MHNRSAFWRSFSLLTALSIVACSGTVRAEYPRGWGGGGKDYELVSDSAVKHGGKASGSIRSTDKSGDSFASFTEGISAEAFRGKRLRLSGWIKAEGVAGWCGLWMRIDGKEKTGIAFDNMHDRAIKDTSDWAQFHVVLDVRAEAEQIYFGCLLAGKGKIWVDDLALEPVGLDVAATGAKLDGAPRQDKSLPDVPKEPANLDFEP